MKHFLRGVILMISSTIFGQDIIQEKFGNGETLKWKEYEINNNKWGENKVKKGVYNQSIFIKNYFAGWKWQTSGKKYGVIGYPEIWFGKSAWRNLSDVKTENYFKRIDELKTFEVAYKTKLEVNDKKYNLAFDFWLHNSPKVALQTIAIEVMIWEDYNKFTPFGKKSGNIKTSFGEYTIYRGHIIKKDLNTSWDYIAFVRKDKRTSGKVNVMELIDEMNKRDFIGQNIYLSSFEFGTEILNSTGNILIEKYELHIE